MRIIFIHGEMHMCRKQTQYVVVFRLCFSYTRVSQIVDNHCTYLTKHDHLYYCLGPLAPIATSHSWFTVYVHTCAFKYCLHAYIRLQNYWNHYMRDSDTLSQFWPISWVSPMMSRNLASTLGSLRNVPTLPLTSHSSPCQSSSFRTKIYQNKSDRRPLQSDRKQPTYEWITKNKLKGHNNMSFFGHPQKMWEKNQGEIFVSSAN